jgi:hypothetical protein
MVLKQICPPALIYLVFSITQVSIDTVHGAYNTALVKIWVAFVFTILLNYLCMSGLNVVSWLIVFIPFILMTVIVSMLLLMFGLDPTTGQIAVAYDKNAPKKQDVRERSRMRNNQMRKTRHGVDRFTAEEYAKWRKYKDAPHINTGYDESNISEGQKKVLDDTVASRAGLACDPLHSDCKTN